MVAVRCILMLHFDDRVTYFTYFTVFGCGCPVRLLCFAGLCAILDASESNMRMFLGCLGNPTLQFFAAFLASPIFAISGEAIWGRGSLGELAGWFVTCLLVSIAAQRSFRHERQQLLPGKLFPFPRPENQRKVSRYDRHAVVVCDGRGWLFGRDYIAALVVWLIAGFCAPSRRLVRGRCG